MPFTNQSGRILNGAAGAHGGILDLHSYSTQPSSYKLFVMDITSALSLILLASVVPLVSGFLATCYKRNFWLWFALGILLPFLSNLLLLLLPDKSNEKVATKPVENDELFDFLFINPELHPDRLLKI